MLRRMAIVDLDDAERPLVPERAAARRGRVASAALASAIAIFALTLLSSTPAPPAPARSSTSLSATPVASLAAAAPAASAAAVTPAAPTNLATRSLALPAGVGSVELAAIPDRLLNDPPAARLRVAVDVRGRVGLASADPPFEIAWSEGGYWYWLRSVDLSTEDLVRIATSMR